jgi:hypothetical protein
MQEPIVIEDHAPVHKKVCIPVRQELGMKCYQHSPNSPDLNPIENIWVYIKHRILKKYDHIISGKAMKQMVISIWNEFGDLSRMTPMYSGLAPAPIGTSSGT